ncbi:Transposase (plasmid) [Mycetohabitans rhizoxinica HKI 454]|uniref:Transposase n=1 Tax=Mycetohabitans rhizoxinica (strain DSM 19002 / CIP 109453 / HKI 454) TaxID=882378 RepID=E5AVQ2_MYCRK|nr:Transposase [Mycetohabitans rhizoxinica HKI 454]
MTIIDDFPKEAVDIVVSYGIWGVYVARALTEQRVSGAIPKRC